MVATAQNSAHGDGRSGGGRARRGGGRGRGAASVRGAGNGGKGEGDGGGSGGGAAGNRRRRRRRDEAEGVKWLGLYSSTQSILLVGEGNFSFSLALATAFGSGANLVATSLDTNEALRNKYCKAESNITSLKRLGATVLHGIDVKKMKAHTDLGNRRFDRIVYNSPHAGFKGREYEVHMIKLHKLGTCCTFKFKIGNLKKRKKQSWRMAGSISSIGGNTRAAHPPPLVQALPWLDFPPPVTTVLMPITLLPHVDVQRQLSGFLFNFNSMPRAPVFHEVSTAVHSVISMPDPSLNALSPPGGIPPPMGRTTSTSVLDPQGHPWYEERFIAEPLGRTDNFFAREYQMSLQREFEMSRQVIPSSNYSSFLEYSYRGSVQRQEGLHRMFTNSCQ